MKTLSERFVSEKREQWMQLRKILLKIRDQSYHALTPGEVNDFPRLYRLACADLARAKTLRLSPDVISYLNNIVGQAHKYLYSFKVLRFSQIKAFFTLRLPFILVRKKTYVLLSALFFLLPYIVTFIICYADPEKASLLVPEDLLSKMADSYRNAFSSTRTVTMSTFALTFYIQHNISIAFFSFAGGLLAGLGTIYFLVYNGILLGAISGFITGQGYGDNFFAFVTAHSIMELSGLVVAGAAGLLLGYSIINATRFYKKDQLNLQKEDIFSLLCAAVLMFVCAAAIEGILSPQPLPYGIKLLVALISAASIIYYFGILPIQRRKEDRGE